jgi:hypothetical protein
VGGEGADSGEVATRPVVVEVVVRVSIRNSGGGGSIDGYRLGGRKGWRSSDGDYSTSGGDDAVLERRWLSGVGPR